MKSLKYYDRVCITFTSFIICFGIVVGCIGIIFANINTYIKNDCYDVRFKTQFMSILSMFGNIITFVCALWFSANIENIKYSFIIITTNVIMYVLFGFVVGNTFKFYYSMDNTCYDFWFENDVHSLIVLHIYSFASWMSLGIFMTFVLLYVVLLSYNKIKKYIHKDDINNKYFEYYNIDDEI